MLRYFIAWIDPEDESLALTSLDHPTRRDRAGEVKDLYTIRAETFMEAISIHREIQQWR